MAVVVPCNNVESCVGRALESVFAQTYQDFCVFAINDGSTDRTGAVLRNYENRVVHVDQIHSGQAAARNRGIRMSQSPFVAFLDADDQWLPEKLIRQIALLKQDDSIGLVCSGCAAGEGDLTGTRSSGTINMPKSGRLFEYMVRDCFVFTPTVVVRRTSLDEVGLFDESLAVGEDFNLWLRIAARWKVAVIPEVLAIRHLRSSSLSLTVSPEVRLRSSIAGLEKVKADCFGLSTREQQVLRVALAEQKYRYGSYLLAIGARITSRSALLSVLRLRPWHLRTIVKLALSFLPVGVYRLFMESVGKLRMPLRTANPVKIQKVGGHV